MRRYSLYRGWNASGGLWIMVARIRAPPAGEVTEMLEGMSERRPYNAAADLIDANVGRGLGDKVAFADPTRTLTYAQLQARTSQFARALLALGLRPESRIALLLHDS